MLKGNPPKKCRNEIKSVVERGSIAVRAHWSVDCLSHIQTLTECSLTAHPAANGYLVAKLRR